MDALHSLKKFKTGKVVLSPKSVRVVKITPKLAKEFTSMTRWKGERPLSASRMAYLLESLPMVYLPFFWCSVVVGNVVYRMNGQHTTYLFTERPHLIQDGMRAICVEFRCDTETEAAVLYAAIDSRTSSRTVSEVNHSFGGGHPRLEGYNRTFIDLCSGGIRMSTRGVGDHGNLDAIERGELLLGHLDFIDFAAEILPGKTDEAKHLWRAPVMFVMHRTYLLDVEAAKRFWTVARDGDSPRGSHPDILRDYLKATALGGTTARSTRSDSRMVMAEKTVRIWNAWRQGKPLRRKVPKVTGHIPDVV